MNLACFWHPPLECRPPKIAPFGVRRGVRRQLCFPRVSEDQFGCVLSVFGRFPNSFFGRFSCLLVCARAVCVLACCGVYSAEYGLRVFCLCVGESIFVCESVHVFLCVCVVC